MKLQEISQLISKIEKFSDDDIEMFVNQAVKQGLTFDSDYLRLILKDIQKKNMDEI